MPIPQTSKPSRPKKEATGVDRLYRRVGKSKVSWYYQYPDGTSETFATAPKADKEAIASADRKAKRRALDIIEGKVIAGSVADAIERFESEIAQSHYRDQSKDGLAVRKSGYENLKKFFGKMAPQALKPMHGYQFLDARAKAGAPKKANKELSLMATICNYMIRWGVIESNPFSGLMLNKEDADVRVTTRSQIVRFYLWALRQPATFRNLGCAAMFAYLTGYRPSEVRPYHVSGLQRDGVFVLNAKRKKGEVKVDKLRTWTTRLRVIVARSKQTHAVERMYLFSNLQGRPYTRSGWGSVWSDAMREWLATFDDDAAADLLLRKDWEARCRADRSLPPYQSSFNMVEHHMYFALSDARPTAITKKLTDRSADAYDFAAHANPATTHKNYDRRKVKKASATE